MRKHGKIRTLHRAAPIFLAALSLMSGSILADLCTERLEEQKQEIQNRQGSEGKRVSKIISEADGAAVQASLLCIRICGYVCPARREELCSSFFSCNRKCLVIPYYKKECILAHSRAERGRLRHER